MSITGKDVHEMEWAAYVLSDEIEQLWLDVQKAYVVMDEINQNFFLTYDPDTKDGRFSIVYEYKHAGTFSEVLFDYMVAIKRMVRSLEDLSLAYIKRKRGEADWNGKAQS